LFAGINTFMCETGAHMKVFDGPVALDDAMANYQVSFVFADEDGPPSSTATCTVFVPVTVPLPEVKKVAFQKARKFLAGAGALKDDAR
jgi:hypothetical protein